MGRVEPKPVFVVLAGPNGAGKSTAAPLLLRDTLAVREFLNADEIARGLSPFAPETVALSAGKVMLHRMRELADQQVSFGVETTLAATTYAEWMLELSSAGYLTHLSYLWLPSAAMAMARVASRVAAGGHGIPDEMVVRRYTAGVRNFHQLYRALSATWRLYDNGVAGAYRLVAWGERDDVHVVDQRVWQASLDTARADGS